MRLIKIRKEYFGDVHDQPTLVLWGGGGVAEYLEFQACILLQDTTEIILSAIYFYHCKCFGMTNATMR